MFFKIGRFKIFAIFTRKHLCWGLFLIKLQTFRLATFLKSDFNTGVSCGYCRTFKNTFYYTTPPVSASDSLLTVTGFVATICNFKDCQEKDFTYLLLTYNKVSLGAYFLISRIHMLSSLIESLHKTLHK